MVKPGVVDGLVTKLNEAADNVEMTRTRAVAEYLAGWEHRTIRQAADTLLALKAEVEELRGALTSIAKAADDAERMAGHDGPLDPMVPLEACRRARAILSREIVK